MTRICFLVVMEWLNAQLNDSRAAASGPSGALSASYPGSSQAVRSSLPSSSLPASYSGSPYSTAFTRYTTPASVALASSTFTATVSGTGPSLLDISSGTTGGDASQARSTAPAVSSASFSHLPSAPSTQPAGSFGHQAVPLSLDTPGTPAGTGTAFLLLSHKLAFAGSSNAIISKWRAGSLAFCC